MAHRVKNDATFDEVASLFRELHPHGNCDALCISESIECFLEAQCELICRLLGLTLRPTGLLIERALKETFNDPPETLVASFSRLLVRAVSRAREVSRSTKTSRGLNPAVARVVASLSRKAALAKSARKLKARISAASDTSDLMVLEDVLRIATDVLDVSSGSDLEEMRTPTAPSRLDILAFYGAGTSSSSNEPSEIAQSIEPSTQELCKFAQTTQPDPMTIEFATPTTVRRLRPDGSALDSRMSPGPRGFAMACFEREEPNESEVPNILLDVDKHAKSCTKRPPPTAKPCMKRPPVRMSKPCRRG